VNSVWNHSRYKYTFIVQGFANWGACTLGVHLPIWWGIFKVGNRREKYVYVSFISNYLYLYQWLLLFKNHYIVIRKYISIIFPSLVTRNFRGTCSSIKILKGCMIRESLGTPVIVECFNYVGLTVESGLDFEQIWLVIFMRFFKRNALAMLVRPPCMSFEENLHFLKPILFTFLNVRKYHAHFHSSSQCL